MERVRGSCPRGFKGTPRTPLHTGSKETIIIYCQVQNVDNVVTFVFKRGPLVWKDGVNVAPGLDVAGECCRSGKVTFAFVPSIAIESPKYCICLLHSNLTKSFETCVLWLSHFFSFVASRALDEKPLLDFTRRPMSPRGSVRGHGGAYAPNRLNGRVFVGLGCYDSCF